MQQPPPSMQPPPQGPQPSAASTGMDKKTAALLAYLVTWVTGIIFLFVGRADPDIKFHGARSLVMFLPIQIIWYLASLLPSGIALILGWLFAIGYLVLWIFCLYSAWTQNGARFNIPILSGVVDPLAEQVASKV